MHCKNCNKEISDDSNFCIFCDAPVTALSNKSVTAATNNFNNQSLQPSQASSFNFKKYMPVLLGVVILLVVAIGLYQYSKKKNANRTFEENSTSYTPSNNSANSNNLTNGDNPNSNSSNIVQTPDSTTVLTLDTTHIENTLENQSSNQQGENNLNKDDKANDISQQESSLATSKNELQNNDDLNNKADDQQASIKDNDQIVRGNKYATGINDSFLNNSNSQTDIKLEKKPTSWSAAQRVTFMTECLGSANKFGQRKGKIYCECMMIKVEGKFPDYNESGERLAKEIKSQEWSDNMDDCLRQIGQVRTN